MSEFERPRERLIFKLTCVFCVLSPLLIATILEKNIYIISNLQLIDYERLYSVFFNMIIVIPLFVLSFFYYRRWVWFLLFLIAVPWTAIILIWNAS